MLASSVKGSQPLPEWEAACDALTVSTELSSSTPARSRGRASAPPGARRGSGRGLRSGPSGGRIDERGADSERGPTVRSGCSDAEGPGCHGRGNDGGATVAGQRWRGNGCGAGPPERGGSGACRTQGPPCLAHGSRWPLGGGGAPTSAAISAKMFLSEPGSGSTSGRTEKARPCAWPGVGYGSCQEGVEGRAEGELWGEGVREMV